MVTLKAVLEALLFAAQKPLSLKEIAATLKSAAEYFEEGPETALAKAVESEITGSLQTLQTEYSELGRAFQLVEQVSGWVLVSRIEYQVWIRQLFPEMRSTRLSAPALETLAIIAYRQPITKADVEAIRGVTVDGVMHKLLEAGLVKIAGRAEIPGRPLLYVTSQHFMEHFGLKNLDELPNASELRELALPKAVATAERRPPTNLLTSDPSDAKPEEIKNGEVEIVPGSDSKAN
ncbi:MAG: SMC-Scp complex subunit ScpB [Verrucomicrobia bacterium]|nr:SMC-Scp complex subunit ScpB [Verrucomicrobiota bacterium]MBV8378997.1 SMC-Scp complex subunit ScpB [Verrucomicrobiota bacterium]